MTDFERICFYCFLPSLQNTGTQMYMEMFFGHFSAVWVCQTQFCYYFVIIWITRKWLVCTQCISFISQEGSVSKIDLWMNKTIKTNAACYLIKAVCDHLTSLSSTFTLMLLLPSGMTPQYTTHQLLWKYAKNPKRIFIFIWWHSKTSWSNLQPFPYPSNCGPLSTVYMVNHWAKEQKVFPVW